MIDWTLTAPDTLPADADRATLVGRVWDPGVDGPCVVVLRGDTLWDVTETFPTMRTLTERDDAAAAAATAAGRKIAGLGEILANTNPDARDVSRPWLLSPIDLHVVKAAGVTFPVSMLERIIEERARGEADAAEGVRAQIVDKDRNPKWSPSTPDGVSEEKVAAFFAPMGDKELAIPVLPGFASP